MDIKNIKRKHPGGPNSARAPINSGMLTALRTTVTANMPSKNGLALAMTVARAVGWMLQRAC